MIVAEQFQDGGLKVVNMNRGVDDVVRIVVGPADSCGGADAAAGEPHAEAAGMMVAPKIAFAKLALAIHRPSKLARPDDKRIVEQPTLFEIANERGGRLIHLSAFFGQLAGQIRVMVPASVVQLDEPHTPLDHAAGQQAVGGERARLPRFLAV